MVNVKPSNSSSREYAVITLQFLHPTLFHERMNSTLLIEPNVHTEREVVEMRDINSNSAFKLALDNAHSDD